jgi:hypothetical protein
MSLGTSYFTGMRGDFTTEGGSHGGDAVTQYSVKTNCTKACLAMRLSVAIVRSGTGETPVRKDRKDRSFEMHRPDGSSGKYVFLKFVEKRLRNSSRRAGSSRQLNVSPLCTGRVASGSGTLVVILSA